MTAPVGRDLWGLTHDPDVTLRESFRAHWAGLGIPPVDAERVGAGVALWTRVFGALTVIFVTFVVTVPIAVAVVPAGLEWLALGLAVIVAQFVGFPVADYVAGVPREVTR